MNTKPSYELAINFLREKFPNLMEAKFEQIAENGKWSCFLTVNGITQISVEDTASEAAQTAAILVAKRFGWIDPRGKKNLKRTNWTWGRWLIAKKPAKFIMSERFIPNKTKLSFLLCQRSQVEFLPL